MRDVDRRTDSQRHGEEQTDERGLQRADKERDDVELFDLPDGLPDVFRLFVIVPLVRQDQIFPFGRVDFGVGIVAETFGDFILRFDLDGHQIAERGLVHLLELIGREFEVSL